jgi:hypothetical protein
MAANLPLFRNNILCTGSVANIAGRFAAVVHPVVAKGRCAGMAQVAIWITPRRYWDMDSVRVVYRAFNAICTVMTCTAKTRYITRMVTSPLPSGCSMAGITFSCKDVAVCRLTIFRLNEYASSAMTT